MTRIYWDTMLFIYWLEDHPQYVGRVQQIFDRMQERGDVLCTSTLTVGEVLVGLKKRQLLPLVQRIQEYFRSGSVLLLPFGLETAERYSDVRAQFRVSPADAIHLASAAEAEADLFLTNDHRLKGLTIPGIRFIAGMETDVL